jgi:periplasmic divalent cation tolerance protein
MEPAKEFSCVLVTAPNITTARKLASAVLKERLAACANLIPKIESHYWWKGALESSAEVLILFKTRHEKLKALESRILQNHPYETPECIAFDLTEGTTKYLAWIAESVKGK